MPFPAPPHIACPRPHPLSLHYEVLGRDGEVAGGSGYGRKKEEEWCL